MPVNVRIPDDLRDRIDAVRGKTKREPWIRGALSAALPCNGCGAKGGEDCRGCASITKCQRWPAASEACRSIASRNDTGAPNG